MIACKPQFPSYLSALLPQDQIFESEPEFNFDPTPVKKRKEQKANADAKEDIGAAKTNGETTEQSEEVSTQQDVIDNPYLRPGKIPNNKLICPNSQGIQPISKKELLEMDSS